MPTCVNLLKWLPACGVAWRARHAALLSHAVPGAEDESALGLGGRSRGVRAVSVAVLRPRSANYCLWLCLVNVTRSEGAGAVFISSCREDKPATWEKKLRANSSVAALI